MFCATRILSVPIALIVMMASHQNAKGEDFKLRQLAQAPLPEQPNGTYSPLEAAEDSYRYAEQHRREAVARQMEMMEYARQPRVPIPGPYVDVRALPVPPGAARRAVRRAARALRDPYGPGYGVVIGLEPRPPVPYVSPWSYFPPVRQPVGHERIWTGPNSYVYKPLYPQPLEPAPTEVPGQPTPAWERPLEPAAEPVPAAVPQLPPADPAPGLPEPPAVPLPGPQEL